MLFGSHERSQIFCSVVPCVEGVGSFIFLSVVVWLALPSAGLLAKSLPQADCVPKTSCLAGWKHGLRFLQGECSKGVCADGVLFKFPSVTER